LFCLFLLPLLFPLFPPLLVVGHKRICRRGWSPLFPPPHPRSDDEEYSFLFRVFFFFSSWAWRVTNTVQSSFPLPPFPPPSPRTDLDWVIGHCPCSFFSYYRDRQKTSEKRTVFPLPPLPLFHAVPDEQINPPQGSPLPLFTLQDEWKRRRPLSSLSSQEKTLGISETSSFFSLGVWISKEIPFLPFFLSSRQAN